MESRAPFLENSVFVSHGHVERGKARNNVTNFFYGVLVKTLVKIYKYYDLASCKPLGTFFMGWDFGWGGTNLSDAGLNLSGSWQQGHSATYNTPSRI